MNKLSYQLIVTVLLHCFALPLAFSEPQNIEQLQKEVQVYYDSGEYHRELTHVIKKATDYINQQVNINNKRQVKQKLALVLDIDETSLSNYNNIIKNKFCNEDKLVHQAILAADLPVISPMLTLYRTAQKQGIYVFFVTGRRQSELQATEKNLSQAGYTQWSGLFLRPKNYHYVSISPFKTHAREMITHKGYTIIASIGDQESDLKNGYAKKTFKLPNPFYYLP